jgi:ABC-2 type transport system ATP-binding protein
MRDMAVGDLPRQGGGDVRLTDDVGKGLRSVSPVEGLVVHDGESTSEHGHPREGIVVGIDGQRPYLAGSDTSRRCRCMAVTMTATEANPFPSDVVAPAVWARGLVRSFGKSKAVDGLDLSINKGEFYGLLGQNGAGKTTTIKMIVGLLRPTSGRAGIGEFDTWKQPVEVKRRIGVLPEEFNLYERLTGAELLDFAAAMHGLDREEAIHRRNELLELLDLGEEAGKLVGDYSRGMRKKVALAAAIIHRPDVLFLDEPFEGVDALSARLIQRLLIRYTEGGATVVFSAHEMHLVERLCTRVGIMIHGKLSTEGTQQELCDRFGADTIEDAFIAAVGGDDDRGTISWLHDSPG